METLEERKIYLARETQNGILIKYPLYQNCYADALEAMWNNIQHNKSENTWHNSQEMHSNIIAFMGVRGSGKTTALCEFNEILRNYDEYREKCMDKLFHKERFRGNKGWFHVLRSIDASLMEKDEDIIELILANMHRDFEEKNQEDRGHVYKDYSNETAKKIIGEFDEVYKNHKQSKENMTILGDTTLIKLRYLASSLKTRENCKNLIKDFLNYMLDKDNKGNEDAFLVVTVDDLDLNLESGYRILENLYRYLNNPQVIVLVAIDFKQMKTLSDKHFVELLAINKDLGDFSNAGHAERLSNDLLLKVLPLSNRIFLPDNKNILKNIEIVDIGRSGNLKPFILGKIAERMGIYYDAVGLKRHFCVPQTLRELIQYNDFLETLYDVDGEVVDKKTQMRLYDANHERFNRDINENMALRVLNRDQLEIFELIMDRNIERRAEYAVNFLNNRKESVPQMENQQRLADTVDDQSYYYSDLLETIYVLGREHYSDKALVHCVLASFTSEMTREYYSYMHNDDPKAHDRAAKRLNGFLGRSFGGEWFYHLGPMVDMPKTWLQNNSDMFKKDSFKFRCACRGDIGRFTYSKVISKGSNDAKKIAEEVSDLVPVMECVVLLFANHYDKAGKLVAPTWQMDIHDGTTPYRERRVVISSKGEKADLDIFGFIGKEIIIKNKPADYAEDIGIENIVVRLFLKGICTFMKKEGLPLNKKNEVACEKILRAQSIWKQPEEHKILFPFYNLDLAYNVMKRVKRKISQESSIDNNGILQYLQRVYGYIAYELQREDRYYAEIDKQVKEGQQDDCSNGQIAPNFSNDFVSYPYIQAIGYQYWDEDKGSGGEKAKIKEEEFNKLVCTILKDFETDWAKEMLSQYDID